MKRTVITFLNLKGGVGKSTSAIHLARYLQLYHGPTTLLDSDDLGTCRKWEGGEGRFGFLVAKPGDDLTTPYVIVDTAAHPSTQEIKAIDEASDLLIVPCQPKEADFDAALKLFSENTLKNAVVLFTMGEARPNPVEKVDRAALKKLRVAVFRTRIRRYAAYDAAYRARTTVDQLAAYGIKNGSAMKAWGDYHMLGEEIMK